MTTETVENEIPHEGTPEAPGKKRRVSYWSIVWGQLQQNKIAVFGLWCIAFLFFIATYAPLFSLNQPFYVTTSEGTFFPFFPSLFNRLFFENAVDVFFNLLMILSPLILVIYLGFRAAWGDRFGEIRGRLISWMLADFFLIFLCFIPEEASVLLWALIALLVTAHLAFVAYLLLRLFGGEKVSASLTRERILIGVGVVTFFLTLGFSGANVEKNPFYYTVQVDNWADKVDELEEAGESPSYLFPLWRYNYRATNPVDSVKPPSSEHWFGTDKEGRDVFTRMLYGTRISLTIGVVAVSIYVFIGIVLGSLAGFFGGWVDMLISRFIEVMICFPTFFLILTLAALIEERSIFHVMVIIGVTRWTGVARLVRAEFLKNKELEYAQAAIALGIPTHRVIFRHILPNAIAPVLVSATFGVAAAILIESSLSFLGVGDLSVPSWGGILNTGRLEGKLWLILVPGLAIFFVVSVFNLVGEGLRDALDPKLRK